MKKNLSTLLIVTVLTWWYTPVLAATDVVNDATLSTNLKGCWSLDETSGSRDDAHTTGNDLTDNNSVGYATGIQSNGADFENSAAEGQYLSRIAASSTDFQGTGDFSFAFWVKPESFPGNGVMMANDDGSNRNWNVYYQTTGRVIIEWFDVSNNNSRIWMNSSGDYLSTGTWYHIAGAIDVSTPGSSTLYVDGSSIPIFVHKSAAAARGGDNAPFSIGAFGGGSTLVDGIIDEAQFWDAKLITGTEVTDLYASGSGIPCDAGGAAAAPIFQDIIWFQ
jgi:hypothetical protein